MNIDNLKLFHETAKLGSFAAVARQHESDPSNISRAIAQLEQQLGIRLFQRSTRKLSLTEAGSRFLDRTEPLLNELDQAVDEAQSFNHQPKGTIRLTASVSFGQTCLVPLLPDFRKRYPDLSLEMQFTDAVVDIVESGIDLACRLAPPSQADLVGTALFSTHYRVCVSPEYAHAHSEIKKPKDLENHPCLVFTIPEYKSTWYFRKPQRKNQSVSIQSQISISNAIALKQCVLQGLGPALLPNWLVDKELDSGKLVRLFPEYECTATTYDTNVWLLYPSRHYLPHKTRVLIDFLKEKLG